MASIKLMGSMKHACTNHMQHRIPRHSCVQKQQQYMRHMHHAGKSATLVAFRLIEVSYGPNELMKRQHQINVIPIPIRSFNHSPSVFSLILLLLT